MKRILLGMAIVAGLAFGGPQILSNAVHQMGGPQLHTGQAQAAYVCRWYTRRYSRPYCRNYYRTRCWYNYGRRYCRRYYVGRRCVHRWYVRRFRRCFYY